jgi:MFS family permease
MAGPAQENQAIQAPASRIGRNHIAFFGDYVFFGLALSVVNANTTLPAFMARLTDSKTLIGLVGAIWFGGWLLPQLVAANFLKHRRLKLPHLLVSSWIGRPFFWLYALFLLLGGAQRPALAIALFMVGFAVFVVTDAYAALAYFDLFGKALPAKERSRVAGAGQVVHGLIAIGAGWVVQRLLSESGPPFPFNYAAVFGLAGVFVMAALASSYLILETPAETDETMTRWRDFLPQLGAVIRQDPVFVRATAVRLIAGIHAMATPFYVLYATQVAGQPESAVGLFVISQTLGAALAGAALGFVAARAGAHRVIQISAATELVTVGLAFTLAATGAGNQLGWLFPILFGCLGIIEGSFFLGQFNFMLDIAPAAERPTYMGLTNTLAGVLAIMPLLGGWILERTSYAFLFGLTAVCVLPAIVLSLWLRKPVPRTMATLPGGEAPVPASPKL